MAPQVKEIQEHQDPSSLVGVTPPAKSSSPARVTPETPVAPETPETPVRVPKIWWGNLFFVILVHSLGLATFFLVPVTPLKLFLVFLVWLPAGFGTCLLPSLPPACLPPACLPPACLPACLLTRLLLLFVCLFYCRNHCWISPSLEPPVL